MSKVILNQINLVCRDLDASLETEIRVHAVVIGPRFPSMSEVATAAPAFLAFQFEKCSSPGTETTRTEGKFSVTKAPVPCGHE